MGRPSLQLAAGAWPVFHPLDSSSCVVIEPYQTSSLISRNSATPTPTPTRTLPVPVATSTPSGQNPISCPANNLTLYAAPLKPEQKYLLFCGRGMFCVFPFLSYVHLSRGVPYSSPQPLLLAFNHCLCPPPFSPTLSLVLTPPATDYNSNLGATIDLYNTPTDTLAQCLDLCASEETCVGAGWGRGTTGGGRPLCWLKSQLGEWNGAPAWSFFVRDSGT